MILIISNSQDTATDRVVKRLSAESVEYCRLDLDLIAADRVILDPIKPQLTVDSEFFSIDVIGSNLKAVFYRAPTHLRESSGIDEFYEKRLQRHQWTAFARSLMCFDTAGWINSPDSTFRAESKPVQLKYAQDAGFLVPKTRITNQGFALSGFGINSIAVKALDSFLVPDGSGDKLFLYTQIINAEDAEKISLQDMPVIMQEGYTEKVDIRVTIVDDWILASEIQNASSITGDWRLKKNDVSYQKIALPENVTQACFRLMHALNLRYGAIDLVRVDSDYIFLEINPTGEWGWLESALNVDISGVIADALIRSN